MSENAIQKAVERLMKAGILILFLGVGIVFLQFLVEGLCAFDTIKCRYQVSFATLPYVGGIMLLGIGLIALALLLPRLAGQAQTGPAIPGPE